jgi:iron complex transport system ATP-binding protein
MSSSDPKEVIGVRHLDLHVAGRLLVSDIAFSLQTGELCALTGRNGTGKSSLLRTICGLMPADPQRVFIMGRDNHAISVSERSKLVAVVTTDRPRLAGINALQCVQMGTWVNKGAALFEKYRPLQSLAVEYLDRVGAAHLAHQSMSRMSDGELQRVLLARALAQNTPLLLLDEPTAFLDFEGRNELMELLHSLSAKEGKTILFSTHEHELASKVAHRIYRIHEQRFSVI